MISPLGSRKPHLLSVLGYPEATLNTCIVYVRWERHPDAIYLHYVKIRSCGSLALRPCRLPRSVKIP